MKPVGSNSTGKWIRYGIHMGLYTYRTYSFTFPFIQEWTNDLEDGDECLWQIIWEDNYTCSGGKLNLSAYAWVIFFKNNLK